MAPQISHEGPSGPPIAPPPPPSGGPPLPPPKLPARARTDTGDSASSSNNRPAPSGGRDDLLAQIRGGASLKHVEDEDREKTRPISESGDPMADALKDVLDKYREEAGFDDSDESEESCSDDDWD